MERMFRIFVGAAIIGGSIWLATRIGQDTPVETQVLHKNFPVAYADSAGENASPVYDSALYERPYLLMRDGELTLNNSCPVRKARLNQRIQPLFVNGAPIGFC